MIIVPTVQYIHALQFNMELELMQNRTIKEFVTANTVYNIMTDKESKIMFCIGQI